MKNEQCRMTRGHQRPADPRLNASPGEGGPAAPACPAIARRAAQALAPRESGGGSSVRRGGSGRRRVTTTSPPPVPGALWVVSGASSLCVLSGLAYRQAGVSCFPCLPRAQSRGGFARAFPEKPEETGKSGSAFSASRCRDWACADAGLSGWTREFSGNLRSLPCFSAWADDDGAASSRRRFSLKGCSIVL